MLEQYDTETKLLQLLSAIRACRYDDGPPCVLCELHMAVIDDAVKSLTKMRRLRV